MGRGQGSQDAAPEVKLPFLRDLLREPVDSGTATVVAVQKRCRTRFLDVAMALVSFLGSQTFYVLTLPMFFWFGWDKFGRNIVFLMVANFYVGNVVKNALQLPRPPSPPVWRGVVMDSDEDFGMPSTHSMNAVSLSVYTLLHYCYHGSIFVPSSFPPPNSFDTYVPHAWAYTYKTHPTLIALGIAAVLVWTLGIAFSRIYLGVHSPADVAVGLSLGCVILNVWWSVTEPLDGWFANTPDYTVPMYCFMFMLVLLLVHPLATIPTSSFPESISLLGTAYGCVLGDAWFHDVVFEHPTPLHVYAVTTLPTLGIPPHLVLWCAHTIEAVCRLLLGFVVLFGLRVSIKSVTLTLLPPLFATVGLWDSVAPILDQDQPLISKRDRPLSAEDRKAQDERLAASGETLASGVRTANVDTLRRRMLKQQSSAIMDGVNIEDVAKRGLAAYGGVRPDQVGSPYMWSKFFVYTSMGVSATYLAPLMFKKSGLW